MLLTAAVALAGGYLGGRNKPSCLTPLGGLFGPGTLAPGPGPSAKWTRCGGPQGRQWRRPSALSHHHSLVKSGFTVVRESGG